MADIIVDGQCRVGLLTAIANIAAPTTTELNLGILLHDVMTSDGLSGFQPDTADVPTSKFSSTFDTNQPGRVSYSNTMLRFCRQTPFGTDTAYNTLARGYVGFVVLRRGIAATTAWASTQVVQVYPIVCGERRDLDPEPNTLQRWESPLKISAQPNLNAVVA